MYCPHCGEQISAHAEICPKCGVRVKNSATSGEDKPNIAINILSFCCTPLLGLIMFFVWKDGKPKAAKSALIWAIVSFVFWVIISIIIGILSALADPYYY